jgi:hypothetical protein
MNKAKKILKKINKTVLVLITAALVLFLWFLTLDKGTGGDGIIIGSEENGWNTYINEEYNFKISFPNDWKVYEDFELTSPIVNVYKPQFDKKPPFDHFSNTNAVSIFPRGVETEALIGQIIDSDIDFETDFSETGATVEKVSDYVLENGQIWARYITFEGLEEPWKPWGSVWSRAEISDSEFYCISGMTGENIEVNNCNPFGGDVFVRQGEIDPTIVEIQDRILESFSFLK